ncbi:MAG: carboxylesterase/lipase family protein [Candidatus Cryptobacteroides sp.]
MKLILNLLALIVIGGVVASCCGRSVSGCSASEGAILASSSVAVVQTTKGKVAGYIQDGIYIYKGIPYAKAERFQAPVETDKWEGIRSCRQYGPVCPQPDRQGWANDEIAFAFNWDDGWSSEDCLRLNIWTPNVGDAVKRPVMVWLHGGGYTAGSGQELPSYDGASLAASENVVVVTINHRLNVLGFLDLSAFGEKYAKSGNAGLLDIVSSLEWVRDNIAAFGGDPSNVTIFGQSGGGGKVSTLLATPSAKGLFHKAIVQSGSMLRTMEAKYSRKIGVATVKNLGLDSSNMDKIAEVPYKELLAAGEKAVAQVKEEADRDGVASFIFGWAPTVDSSVLPVQPFDSQAPSISTDIPMIIGTTRHEFTMTTYVPAFREISRDDAVKFLENKYGDGTSKFMELFAKAYPGYKPADLLDADFVFRPSAIEQALRKSQQGGAPVFMYLFTWESPVLDGILRSTHCMEIPFVFNNASRHASMTGGGAEALELASKMSHCWAEFARTGKPFAEGVPEWEPFDSENRATMFFDNTCKVEYNHDKELIDFIRRYPTRGF